MKKRDHQDTCAGSSYGGRSSSVKREYSAMSSGKAKMWEDQQQDQQHDGSSSNGGGMDELLAALGYKVRSSDMADVAQKLEQLEMVMGITQQDGISHLASDTIHHNPTDINSWAQSMLTELNPYFPNTSNNLNLVDPSSLLGNPQIENPSRVEAFNDDSEYDLRAIPGIAAYPQPEPVENTNKRFKSSQIDADSPPPVTVSEPTRPVVLFDSQETGVRLVHALMACADAVQQENLKVADALVKHVGMLAKSQIGAMRKVASCFAQALARRIYRIYPQETLDSDMLHMHFYESCPYLKFAHFTANQAILEAFSAAGKVHVIDFGLKQGMQWPALMQALALRPGGPPTFRLTGIGPPQNDNTNTDALQQVGWKLAQLAQTIGVQFEFRGFVCNSLADLDPNMLEIRPGEAVAVNSVFELHRMLARPGSVEKVFETVKKISPRIVTVVEQEANHNGPVFMDRFTEALHYYSSLFDSLEGSAGSAPSQDLLMSELYLGWQICNVVACEGVDRVERHETLSQWRVRMGSAGFEPVHLGSNAFKQASMLLALFAGGDGYRVEENNGCLMLGWHTRPLIATSAWKLPGSDSE